MRGAKLLAWIVGVAAGAIILVVIAAVIYGYATHPGWVGVSQKKLWDWLDLLIVPFILGVGGAIGGYLFSRSENRNAQVIAERRAQDEALQSYLDQISELLLNRKLRDPEAGSEARTLARARTVTVFKRQDAAHNRSVLHFLRDARLLGDSANQIINFNNADLRWANLAEANLQIADLSDADLRDAKLTEADLSGANLEDANLSSKYPYIENIGGGVYHKIEPNLGGTNLSKAKLHRAKLRHATLIGVNLRNTDLYGADLSEAELIGSGMEDVNLGGADLRVDLSNANLSGADLRGAYLRGANLRGAKLVETNLRGAVGITTEKLKQQVSSLEGAIMPDGSKIPDSISPPQHLTLALAASSASPVGTEFQLPHIALCVGSALIILGATIGGRTL
jgi:uncharacterized protein YjbI with pentapeptide repeats